MLKTHIYVAQQCAHGPFNIKNCSLVYKNICNDVELRWVDTIDECDICIIFVGEDLPQDVIDVLNLLYTKKLIFVFTNDAACTFDRSILNISNVIGVFDHTVFRNSMQLYEPTLCTSLTYSKILNKSNSKQLQYLQIEKVQPLLRSYWCYENCSNLLPLTERKYDICCMIGTEYDGDRGALISESRQNLIDLMKMSSDKYNIIFGRLSRSEYIEVLKNSKIVLSPMGWGESCWPRDFEIAACGAVGLKNCNYIKSNPDVFANFSYCAYDYSDIFDVVDDVLANLDTYQLKVDDNKQLILTANDDAYLQQIRDYITTSFNKYTVDHNHFNNLIIFGDNVKYEIIDNDIILTFTDIQKIGFSSIGIHPVTDYDFLFSQKCNLDKEYIININFNTPDVPKIRYYDGQSWIVVHNENSQFNFTSTSSFSTYNKTRIGFFYEDIFNKPTIRLHLTLYFLLI
jgi:hypothetical protein